MNFDRLNSIGVGPSFLKKDVDNEEKLSILGAQLLDN
jgi:hypothetical protein